MTVAYRNIYRRFRTSTKNLKKACQAFGKTKVFCIGRNKTGTTSLAKGLYELGFITCNQLEPKLLIEDWAKRDFRRILQFCKTAEAFHDQPFSLPFTFQILDYAYPRSKFILTVRDDPDQWYQSVTRYMAKRYGGGKLPTIVDLKKANYINPGWIARTYPLAHGVPEDDLFNKDILIKHYCQHNEFIMNYFRYRPEDLLVINVSKHGAWQELCRFLERDSDRNEFLWENKT